MEQKKLEFDNSWVPSGGKFISISQVLEMVQEKFDADGVIDKNYEKWQSNPESPYYGLTKEQIKESWKAKGATSTMYGRKLDDYIGECLTGDDISKELWEMDNNREQDERLNGLCKSFDEFNKEFLSKPGIEFVAREKEIYYEAPDGLIVKGRFDALFYNNIKDYWIVIDWKSSGTIDKIANQWTKKLLGPAFQLPALNHVTYTMQTHFYKMALLNRYLPAGTPPEKVYTFIVDLPGKYNEQTKLFYDLCQQAMPYDPKLMDDVFGYAYKKRDLLKRKSMQG